jgi:hypothetical protein
LIADGTPTTNDCSEKTRLAYADCPDTNMWWPQTKKPTPAIAIIA